MTVHFRFMSGPWENSRVPTIVRSDPAGGDPHIIASLARIHNPQALHELCALANEAMDGRFAAMPLDGFAIVPIEPTEAIAAAYKEAAKGAVGRWCAAAWRAAVLAGRRA